jgi:hypothetical protein
LPKGVGKEARRRERKDGKVVKQKPEAARARPAGSKIAVTLGPKPQLFAL